MSPLSRNLGRWVPLVAVGTFVVAGAMTTPATWNADQSLAPAARAALTAYWQAGAIPRADMIGWATRGTSFKKLVARQAFPEERRQERRHWSPKWARYLALDFPSVDHPSSAA